jgi:hypothetical protein
VPLKWCAERIEEFLAATHGRDISSKAELALDGDGRVLALRIDSLANVGACGTPAGVVIQLMIGPWVSTSIYDIGTIDIRIRAVLTNTAPTGAYRGAGRPEAIYIIERLMDAAARQTGIDPVELRRRNMIRPEQMPYRNAMDKTYDSGQFELVPTRHRARRLEGLTPGPPICIAAEACAGAAWRLSRMDRGRYIRGTRDGHGRRLNERPGRDRDFLGDAGDGTGTRDDLCAARRRRVRRADRFDPHRAGRHRPRHRLR